MSPALHGMTDTDRTHHKALLPTTKKIVRRSRVQLRGPPAQKNKGTSRARADHCTKPMSLLSQQFASKQSWVESVFDREPITTANEVLLIEDEHVNNNQEIGVENFVFPKITLPSNKVHEEQAENNVEAHTFPAKNAPAPPPLSDSWFESPPASWVKLASIYDRRRVPLIPDADPDDLPDDFLEEFPSFSGDTPEDAGPESTPESLQLTPKDVGEHFPRTATPKTDQPIAEHDGEHSSPITEPVPVPGPELVSTQPTRSLLQRVVELFAGRKKRPTPIMLKARAKPNVPLAQTNPEAASEHSEPTLATDSHPSTYPEPDSEPEQEPEPPSAPRRAPPAFFDPPLLTHAQVIPTVVKKNPCKVFSTEDLCRADIVHRSFRPHHHPDDHVVTGHKRNNSAGQLLDREGDVWANWYSKRNEVGSDPPRHVADSMIW